MNNSNIQIFENIVSSLDDIKHPVSGRDFRGPQRNFFINLSDRISSKIKHNGDISSINYALEHACGTGKTDIMVTMCNIRKNLIKNINLIGDQKKYIDLLIIPERAPKLKIMSSFFEAGLNIVDIKNLDKNRDLDNGKDIDIIITTIQALNFNCDKLVEKYLFFNVFGDEADCYLTEKRKKIINKFEPVIKLGLTATPEWQDGRHIRETWGETIHEYNISQAIIDGLNTPIYYFLFQSTANNSEKIPITGGDYSKSALNKALKRLEIEQTITEIYNQISEKWGKNKKSKCLVYVPSLDLVNTVLDNFNKLFKGSEKKAVSLYGSMSTKDMNEIIKNYSEGKIDVMVLCEMGGRGLDVPSCNFVLDAYPTKSKTKLMQRYGRALRVEEGKDRTIIVQIKPTHNNFRPCNLMELLDFERLGQGIIYGNNGGVSIASEKFLEAVRITQADIESIIRDIKPVLKKSIYECVDVKNIGKGGLENIPVSNDNGILYFKNQEYRTISGWALYYNLKWDTVKKYLDFNSLSSRYIMGLLKDSRLNKFYSKNDMEKAIGIFLKFEKIDDDTRKTINSWVKILREEGKVICGNTLKRLLSRNGIKPKKLRTNLGILNTYTRKQIYDLIDKRLDNADSGEILYEDSTYFSTKKLYQFYLQKGGNLSYITFTRKLSKYGDQKRYFNIKGKKSSFFPKNIIYDIL